MLTTVSGRVASFEIAISSRSTIISSRSMYKSSGENRGRDEREEGRKISSRELRRRTAEREHSRMLTDQQRGKVDARGGW